MRLVDQTGVVSIATGTRDLAESVTGALLTSDRLSGSGPVGSSVPPLSSCPRKERRKNNTEQVN